MLRRRIALVAVSLLPFACGDSAGGNAEPGTTGTTGAPSANDTTGLPADSTSSSSSAGSGSSSSGGTSSSSGGSSSGEPEETCDNGVVDPGELCFGRGDVFEMGRSARDVFVDDYDLDGNLDIASLDPEEPALYIRYGDGRRGFSEPDEFEVTAGAFGMDTGDLDLDGDVDIVVFGSQLTVFVNNAGVVEPFAQPSPGVITGQLNDGMTGELDMLLGLDIVHTGRYSAFFQRGTLAGTTWEFGAQTLLPAFEGASGVATGVFGFDGDQSPDLVVINRDRSTAQLLSSDGDGEFALLKGDPEVCPVGSGAYRVETGDLDGDDNMDIVTTCDVGVWTVAYGLGDGTFEAPLSETVETVFQLQTADIDQDGDLDVLVTQSILGHIEVFLNNGRGPFTFDTTLDSIGDAWSFGVTDVDRDGALDVIAALTDGPNGSVAVFWANP